MRRIGSSLITVLLLLVGIRTAWSSDEVAQSAPEDAASIKRHIERGDLRGISEADFRKILSRAEPKAILEAALLILREHPQYSALLTKRERVRDQWPERPDVIALRFQRHPKAAFLEYIDGPRKGRRVVYNQALHPNEMHVRESGWLGWFSVTLRLDNPLTRRDSNHSVLELGLEYPLERTLQDLKLMNQSGRKIEADRGKWIEEKGRHYWEIEMTSPGPPQFYSHWARLRFEVESGLLVTVEVRDAQGRPVELIAYQDVRWRSFPPSTFTPQSLSTSR